MSSPADARPPATAADPTSSTVEGMPLHTRSLSVAVKRTSEARWRARGDIVDLRKNGFVPSNYDLQPSGIIHMMSIELDFDPETRRIDGLRVEQPFVAIEPSKETQGECCRDPAPRLQALAGEVMDEGFVRKLGTEFGGALGCSHLLTLFQLMASTVPRAVDLEVARIQKEGTEHDFGVRFFRRSVFLDGLEKSAEATDVSLQLADTLTRPLVDADGPMTDRLALSHEVKTFASIDRTRFLIDRLSVRERKRTHENLGYADWVDHSEHMAPLVGVRMIPGLAGRIFKLTGGDEALEVVRDNLLQFAPGFLQVIAAQMDQRFEEQARQNREGGTSLPEIPAHGGSTDSCYMWRTGGPVQKAWFKQAPGER